MKSSMVERAGAVLAELGQSNVAMVVLYSDLADGALIGPFRERFPQRCFDMAFRDLDMAAVASGLAFSGKEVWVCAPAWRLIPRTYQVLRGEISLARQPVRLISCASGLTAGVGGAQVQMLEDLALMRPLADMAVQVPSDGAMAEHLIRQAAKSPGPIYLRLSSLEVPDLERPAGLIQGAGSLRDGAGVTLCACGILVHQALKAAEILSHQGIDGAVIDCFSLKPLPEEQLLSSVRRTGCCVVAEEHSHCGGLGEAVASLCSASYPVPVKTVSVRDRGGQSGTAEELLDYYGLSSQEIVSAAVQAWTMRRR